MFKLTTKARRILSIIALTMDATKRPKDNHGHFGAKTDGEKCKHGDNEGSSETKKNIESSLKSKGKRGRINYAHRAVRMSAHERKALWTHAMLYMTKEQRRSPIVTMNMGEYLYTFVHDEDHSIRVLHKVKIKNIHDGS